MALTTILVHLGSDSRNQHRLETAAVLARRHDAHVIGLHTAPEVHMPLVGRAASAVFLEEIAGAERERTDEARASFEAFCRREGLAAAWRAVTGDPVSLLEEHAYCADITIVSQTPAETLEDRVVEHLPHHLSLLAGVPSLVLPHAGAVREPGRRVLIGWKPCREAARAVRDAIPMLTAAEAVVVLTIGAADADHRAGGEIGTFLARHGVRVETRANYGDAEDAGEVILAHARDVDADMIVIGAYGRSRWRELVLGGATRQVLHGMGVPVFLSH